MDKDEAQLIANEALSILIKKRATFSGAYEYIAGELDITDEELEKANDILNDDE